MAERLINLKSIGVLIVTIILELAQVKASPLQETFCRSRSSSWKSGIISNDDSFGRLRSMTKRERRFEFITPALMAGDLRPTPLQTEVFGVLLDTRLKFSETEFAEIKFFIGPDEMSLDRFKEISSSYTFSSNCVNFIQVDQIDFQEFYNTTSLIVFEVTSPSGSTQYFGDYFQISEGNGSTPRFISDSGPGGIIRVGNANEAPLPDQNTAQQDDEGGCHLSPTAQMRIPSSLGIVLILIFSLCFTYRKREDSE